MIKQIWSKNYLIVFSLSKEDIASEIQPLPLYLSLTFHHYIGFYFPQIKQFFNRYTIFPNCPQQFWIQYQGLQIKSSQIVSNIIMRYFSHLSNPPVIIVHYRCKQPHFIIDLNNFYNQTLKSSTYIKDKKKGLNILLSEFSKQQFNNLYIHYKSSTLDEFLGSAITQQSANNNQSTLIVGYNHLLKTLQLIPLIILTKNQKIERQSEPNSTLLQLKKSIFGQEFSNYKFFLYCVQLADQIKLSDLKNMCHPDGYIYLYIQI